MVNNTSSLMKKNNVDEIPAKLRADKFLNIEKIDFDSEEYLQYMKNIEKDLNKIDLDYLDSLDKDESFKSISDYLFSDKNDNRDLIIKSQKARGLANCLMPLMFSGVNANSISRCVISYMLYSQTIGNLPGEPSFLGEIGKKMKAISISNNWGKNKKKLERLENEFSRSNSSLLGISEEEYLKQKEDIQNAISDNINDYFENQTGFKKFTPRQLSLMQMKLSIDYYDNMRKDGANINTCTKEFNEKSLIIKNYANSLGIDDNTYTNNFNMLVGSIIRHNNEFSKYFEETNAGVYTMDFTSSNDEKTKGIRSFTGNFIDSNGNSLNKILSVSKPKANEKSTQVNCKARYVHIIKKEDMQKENDEAFSY